MSKTIATNHTVVWEDDGAVGFDCLANASKRAVPAGPVHVEDKDAKCDVCGQRLQVVWNVRLYEYKE